MLDHHNYLQYSFPITPLKCNTRIHLLPGAVACSSDFFASADIFDNSISSIRRPPSLAPSSLGSNFPLLSFAFFDNIIFSYSLMLETMDDREFNRVAELCVVSYAEVYFKLGSKFSLESQTPRA